MKRLGIIGLGLMGGSLGMAVKHACSDITILGYARREENRQRALELGAVDVVSGNPREIIATADLVVCCLPVLAIPEILNELADAFKDNAVITDVGSTKETIQREMTTLFSDRQIAFVGSHPICGSEMKGIEFARADLYQNAVTIITNGDNPVATTMVAYLWRLTGSRVIKMDAAQHDRYLARTSHLPHLTASLLSATIGRDSVTTKLAACCGTGFKDTTRLAEGTPEIWKDIVQTNHEEITNEFMALKKNIEIMLAMLENRDFEAIEIFLTEARDLRRKMIAMGEKQHDSEE